MAFQSRLENGVVGGDGVVTEEYSGEPIDDIGCRKSHHARISGVPIFIQGPALFQGGLEDLYRGHGAGDREFISTRGRHDVELGPIVPGDGVGRGQIGGRRACYRYARGPFVPLILHRQFGVARRLGIESRREPYRGRGIRRL